ncbi:MAG: ATP-binding protein [Candidatus Hydrogenedentota bacterium]
MISQFRVQNYKALRDVTLDLTPMHVLIGPNDSGKTSVLEALQVLSKTLDRQLSQAIPSRRPKELFSFGDTSTTIGLAVTVGESAESPVGYTLNLTRHGDNWGKLDVLSSGYFGQLELSGSNPHFSAAFQWLRKGERKKERNTPSEEDICAALKEVDSSLCGIQFYRWIPRFLASPAALNEERRYRMEESGFGLPTMLDDILGYDIAQFEALQTEFRRIFPEVERIILRTEKGYREQPTSSGKAPDVSGKGLAIKFKGADEPLSAASVSDGFLLILAYLSLIHSPQPPPVLLIEEPENGIHPKRLRDVINMLKPLTQEEGRTQIIMTTHSPDLLDLFDPEEVTLCLKEDDGSVSAHRLSESEVVQQQKGVFTLGEIWGGEMDEVLAHGPAKSGKTRKNRAS